MHRFFVGMAIFLCQFHGTKAIPVCRPDQIDKTPAQCVSYRGYGFCILPSARVFMQRNCPITCGFCQAPPPTTARPPTSTRLPSTKTLSPTTTRFPTTALLTLPECRVDQVDKDPAQCTTYSQYNFCTAPKARQFMERNCPVTCGICQVPPTRPPTTTTAPTTIPLSTATPLPTSTPSPTIPACRPDQVEKDPAQCAIYSQYRFCTDPNARLFMEKNCPVTCGICEVPPTRPPTTTTPPTTTLPSTVTQLRTTTSSPTIPICKPNRVDLPTGECKRYANVFGSCTSNVESIRQSMIKNCPVACGLCRGRSTPATTPQKITTQAGTTPGTSTREKTTSKPTTQQKKTSAPTTKQPATPWPTINMDMKAWKAWCHTHGSFSVAPSGQASFLDNNSYVHNNL